MQYPQILSLNGESDLKPSFVETRVKLIVICLKEKTAITRWKKVKEFLVERLESQVLSAYITQGELQDDEVEPSHIMSYLMDPNSFLSQCIKTIVLFNITDDKAKVPKELLIDFGLGIEYSFPFYTLYKNNILLIAKTKDGRIIKKEVPFNEDNAVLTIYSSDLENKISWTYTQLLSEKSKKYYTIFHDDFYRLFRKLHKDIVERYNLDSSKNPSYWLSKFEDSISSKEKQRQILRELTGVYIEKWVWVKREGRKIYDISKTAKVFFPEVKEKIVSIRPIYPIPWKPDNSLFNENTLRYELIEQYLKRFQPEERDKLLLENIEDFSIFNLVTFRNLVEKWERDKDITKINLMLQRLLFHYSAYKKSSRERNKMIQYVKINRRLLNNQVSKKKMESYRLASPNEKVNTVQQRYLRQKKKLKEEGYDVDSLSHISQIMRKWNISDSDLMF